MLNFKQFLNEAHDEVIPVDGKWLESNAETMNNELEVLTAKPYQNAPIFLNQLRSFLERYGATLPASATPHFLNLSAEIVYALGDTEYSLYIVYETNDDGYVDGYAQLVTADELQDLLGMDADEILGDRNALETRPSTWYAKRDDDAGNSDEY